MGVTTQYCGYFTVAYIISQTHNIDTLMFNYSEESCAIIPIICQTA